MKKLVLIDWRTRSTSPYRAWLRLNAFLELDCLPACLLACLPACLPVCLLACLPACLPACLHACLPAMPSCLPSCLFACLLAYLLACMLACILACLLTWALSWGSFLASKALSRTPFQCSFEKSNARTRSPPLGLLSEPKMGWEFEVLRLTKILGNKGHWDKM